MNPTANPSGVCREKVGREKRCSGSIFGLVLEAAQVARELGRYEGTLGQ
jgi:hypothetical protein